MFLYVFHHTINKGRTLGLQAQEHERGTEKTGTTVQNTSVEQQTPINARLEFDALISKEEPTEEDEWRQGWTSRNVHNAIEQSSKN